MRSIPLPIPPSLLLGACLGACTRPAPPVAESGPEWTAVPVARIAGDTGVRSFATVRSLLFAPTGELYVVDQRDKQIKVFDTAGTFLRFVGRSGAGPGEYADPYSLAWLHDTLAVLDPGNSRIGLFAPGERWAGALPVQPITGGTDVRLYRTGLADFWAYGFKVKDRRAQSLLVHYTGAGPQDTLTFYRSDGPNYTITCETADKALHFFASPFSPKDLLIPSPSGSRLFARTDAYRIYRLGPSDDTVRYVRRDEPLPAITDREWQDSLADWHDFRARTASPKCDGNELTRPKGKAVLAALFYDPNERLWIEVHTATEVRYDLWDPTGYPAGRVSGLPPTSEVDPTFLGDLIALALPDTGEGPGIGIYRLTETR